MFLHACLIPVDGRRFASLGTSYALQFVCYLIRALPCFCTLPSSAGGVVDWPFSARLIHWGSLPSSTEGWTGSLLGARLPSSTGVGLAFPGAPHPLAVGVGGILPFSARLLIHWGWDWPFPAPSTVDWPSPRLPSSTGGGLAFLARLPLIHWGGLAFLGAPPLIHWPFLARLPSSTGGGVDWPFPARLPSSTGGGVD
ncbi:hypothetical protein CYMTET_33735 [Cymbomonas tetramitiformis]|uniref:Uncharacterized protein n=1 Tax=Cymbomonas tetramitiformis TaxID=36881 RepID=A0AAE0FCH6_9CHLO|nr:hypothetical protein CYMTET_33735 [Cymbomonas tetramitiformis]